MAAALPQVSHEHSTQKTSSKDAKMGAAESFSNGVGMEMHREQQTELDAEGMPCTLLAAARWVVIPVTTS